jgi:penicillin-binding protein 1A
MEEVVQLIGDAASVKVPTKRIPPVLSLSLGTAEMSSLELAAAYCVFPRGGKSVYPTMIRRISDTRGNVYYDSKRKINPYFRFLQPEGLCEVKTLLSQETACEMLQMMGGVFERGGTGYWAATTCGLNKKAYGKSGTTQDYKDGWFAGLTGKEVSACWVGIDSGESLLLSGEATAAVIWTDYNAKVFSDTSAQLPISENMKLLKICRESGLEASSRCENCIDFYFNANAALPERCYIHSDDIMIIEEDF